jgi:hypothetical protein
MTDRDADRLKLLDRIAERVPELDLAQRSIEWTTLDDGSEGLLVDGGGIDGGNGAYFANCGDDVHAVGTLAPLIEGYISLARCRTRWASRSWISARPPTSPLRVASGRTTKPGGPSHKRPPP